MSESVNGPTDSRTHGHRLESHPISSPRAFRSGELKISASNQLTKFEAASYKNVDISLLKLSMHKFSKGNH